MYWLKLKQRKQHRWTSKALEWATQNPNKSKWMTEINKGLREIQWTSDPIEGNPINVMKNKLKATENKELLEELKEKKCEHYPKTNIQCREQYMYKKRDTKGLLKFRTRDLETGPQKRGQKCHKCDKQKENIIHHILYECTALNDTRQETGLHSHSNTGKTEQEITTQTKKIMENTDRTNTKALQKMWEKWNETDQDGNKSTKKTNKQNTKKQKNKKQKKQEYKNSTAQLISRS